jgi:hypothetical protein
MNSELLQLAESRGLPVDASLACDLAIFSPDRSLRYVLTRQLGAGPRVLMCCGLNPSSADAFRDDPTIRRVKSRAVALGCGLYVMLNSYAFRATQPMDMWIAGRDGADIVGPHNDEVIALVLGRLGVDDVALAAWGTHAQPTRVQRLREISAAVCRPWQCLGANRDGSPKHPLYLAATTPLVAWQ